MIGEQDINLSEARVGGTEINYYFVCKKKLWLFANGIRLEHTSDRVDYANLVHESSYPRTSKLEVLVDGLLRIDLDSKDGVIHEIKMTKAFQDAHHYQLLYYLYYLKQKGMIGLKGEINYPKLKKKDIVELTPELEQEMEDILSKVRELKISETCPQIGAHATCKKCSYENFCWG